MRDMVAEHFFVNHPIIGYVPLDEDGQPYKPVLGRGRHKRTKPTTLYQTLARAITQSPVDRATEVRMFQPIEVTDNGV